ncbi:TonB-dependent receptor, partial [Terriglobus sp. YAF25]
ATPTSFNSPIAQGTSPRDLRQSVFGGYITDNYRISPNLTLNLGIRYEPVTVPTETANRIAVLPTLTSVAPRLGSPYFQNASYTNIAPRVGFAWDPFGKDVTSVRGGFGLYDTQTLNYLYEGLSIFTAPYLLLGNITTLGAGDFPKNAYSKMNAAGASGLRYAYADQNPKRGYVEQYSLNVQQSLSYGFTLQVGYAGSRGIHLPYRVDDVNTVQPIRDAQGYGFFGPNCTVAANCKTAAQLNATKLNSNIGQISAVFMTGYSHYNSLQASLNKRLSHSTQLGISYTWAKSIDDGSSSTFGDTFANSVSSLPLWAPDRRRAISDFVVAHNLVLNYLYELPNVRETMLGSALLNGWQWGGIFQFSTGEPFTPLISGDPLNLKSADVFAFPDRLTSPGCSGNPTQSFTAINRAFVKTQCFAFPAVDPATGYTHLGNAGRNSIIGPRLSEFDTSLIKNTRIRAISESFNLQFRAELFNVLNHGNYGPPPKAGTQLFGANGVALSPASAGVIVGPAATSSRQAQFALKVLF